MATCASLPEERHILHTKFNYENKKVPVSYAVSNNIFCSMPLSLEERTLHIHNTPCVGNQYAKGGSRASDKKRLGRAPTAILRRAIYGGQVVLGTGSNVADQAMSLSQRSRRVIGKLRHLFLSGEEIRSLLCFTRTGITYLFRNKKKCH